MVDGLSSWEQPDRKIDYIVCRGKVEYLTLRDVDITRTSEGTAGALLRTLPGCDIGELTMQRVALRGIEQDVAGDGHIGIITRA